MPDFFHGGPVGDLAVGDGVDEFEDSSQLEGFFADVVFAGVVFDVSHVRWIFGVADEGWKDAAWLVFTGVAVFAKAGAVVNHQGFGGDHFFFCH